MNKIKLIIALVIFTTIGYFLGNFFPFNSTQTFNKGIQGKSILEVRIVTEHNNPLTGIEVNIAEKAGPPPPGGIALTDNNGIAVFNIKPGNYFIFFNSSNFPVDFVYPEPQIIEVKEGMLNNQTVVLLGK